MKWNTTHSFKTLRTLISWITEFSNFTLRCNSSSIFWNKHVARLLRFFDKLGERSRSRGLALSWTEPNPKSRRNVKQHERREIKENENVLNLREGGGESRGGEKNGRYFRADGGVRRLDFGRYVAVRWQSGEERARPESLVNHSR